MRYRRLPLHLPTPLRWGTKSRTAFETRPMLRFTRSLLVQLLLIGIIVLVLTLTSRQASMPAVLEDLGEIALVIEDGQEQVEHANVQVVLEAERIGLDDDLFGLGHHLPGVVAQAASDDAVAGLQAETPAAVRVAQRGAGQEHELVGRDPLYAGVHQTIYGVHD